MAQCPICNGLTDTQRLIPFSELQYGPLNHCKECGILRSAITSFPELLPHIDAILWHAERVLCLQLLNHQNKELATIELYTDQGHTAPWKIIGSARTVPVAAWDSNTAQLARVWLDDCLARHTICRSPTMYELPTRVLDVATDTVSLYITDKERVPYVALSHCWGGEMALITTRANLTQHQNGVEFGESAKTCAHAVQVTRDLGLRYLWIDSLCIIQDDPEDWAVEANKMTQVYKNAIVTISAETARATSEGLFVPEATREKHQVIHHIGVNAGPSLDLTIHARLRSAPSQRSTLSSHSSTETVPSPLSKRAWTLQERLLPSRTLHFYEEELVWTCNSVSCCQCRIDAGIPFPSTFKRLEVDTADKGQLEFDLVDEWYDIVTQFTARALTKADDRLAALSGLATLYHEKTSQHYFAGLWEADMPFALLWISNHDCVGAIDHVRRHTPENDPVATWSWAAVTGPVKYLARHKTQFERQKPGASLEPLLHVFGGSVKPDPLLPFGSVGKGVVVVHGQLLAVNFDLLRELWRPRRQGAAEPLVEPRVIIDVLSESPEHHSATDEAADYYFLRAATYIQGLMSTNSGENFCILLKKVAPSDLSQAFGGRVFERCGVVFHGFGSAEEWSEEQTPSVKLCIV